MKHCFRFLAVGMVSVHLLATSSGMLQPSTFPDYYNESVMISSVNFIPSTQLVNRGGVVLDPESQLVVYIRDREYFKMSWNEVLAHARQYDPTNQKSVIEFEKFFPLYKNLFQFPQLESELTLELGMVIARYYVETAKNPLIADDYIQSEPFSLAYEYLLDEEKDSPILARVSFLSGRIAFEMKEYRRAYAYFIDAYSDFGDHSDPKSYAYIDPSPEKCSQHYQRALCLLHATRSLTQLGWFDEVDQLLHLAWEELSNGFGDSHSSKLLILYEKAEIALKARQPDKAQEIIDRIRAMEAQLSDTTPI